MHLLKKHSKASKITRASLWTITVITAFWTADILDKQENQREKNRQIPQLALQIQKIWLQKILETDTINSIAQKKIKELNLKPSQKMPQILPEEKTKILTEYTLQSKDLHATCLVLTTIENTVPEEGKPPATTCIIADPKILDNGFQIHPNHPDAKKNLAKAFQQIEQKKKLKEQQKTTKTQPQTPNQP